MAGAEASFSISIEAMSEGLRLFSGLRGLGEAVKAPDPPTGAPSFTGIPSITYNGLLPAVIEVTPLILMLMALPGSPESCDTCTPAALPCNNCCTFTLAPGDRSAVFSDTTAPV